jgi:hypothetical protein
MANQQPNSTNDASNPPDKKQQSPGDPSSESTGSRREIHAPETQAKNGKCGANNKHALDYATAIFAFIAAVATGAAAIFTGWQAWVANDTEHRQLRAYIHPVIDRESVDLDQSPMKWTYILKNFGQTPACHVRTSGRLFVGPLAFAVDKKPEVINHYGTEPRYCLAPQEEHRITLYFSLNHTERALSAAIRLMLRKLCNPA